MQLYCLGMRPHCVLPAAGRTVGEGIGLLMENLTGVSEVSSRLRTA